MERSSLSGMSVVLPVIIIQARFSYGRSCGHSVRSFGTHRFLKAVIMRDRVQWLFIG